MMSESGIIIKKENKRVRPDPTQPTAARIGRQPDLPGRCMTGTFLTLLFPIKKKKKIAFRGTMFYIKQLREKFTRRILLLKISVFYNFFFLPPGINIKILFPFLIPSLLTVGFSIQISLCEYYTMPMLLKKAM